jgi:hypothetical protein
MNNQGKTQKQYKDSARFAWFGVLGMIIILILLAFLSSCSITKTTTHNCELMEQGQKCLPDHSCCK